MKELSYLRIDLARIEENVQTFRKVCARSKGNGQAPLLCAVIKKNAYGLGAVPVGARLSKAGCDILGVYSAQEASELISAGITAHILLLGPLGDIKRTDLLYRPVTAGKLHVSVHRPCELEIINKIGHTFAAR